MFEIGFPCDPGQVMEMLQFGRILALYYWQEEKCHLRRCLRVVGLPTRGKMNFEQIIQSQGNEKNILLSQQCIEEDNCYFRLKTFQEKEEEKT